MGKKSTYIILLCAVFLVLSYILVTTTLSPYSGINPGIEMNLFLKIAVLLICFAILSFIIFIKVDSNGSFSEALSAIKRITEGDLTKTLKPGSNAANKELGGAVNSLIYRIRGFVGDVAASSEKNLTYTSNLSATINEINVASEEIARSVSEIAEGLATQSQFINEIKQKTETIRESSGSVKERAAASKELGELMVKGIQEFFSALNRLIDIMEASSEKDNELISQVQELNKKATDIGNISQMVKDISDLTNLLALNAAIEAARAGEQGRGFAVVAEEVRKLAHQSSTSADNIGDLVNQITGSMQELSVITRNQSQSVKESLDFAHHSKEIFDQILDISNKTEASIKEILEFATNESILVEDINDTMEQLLSIVQGFSANTQEVSATTEEQAASVNEIAAGVNKMVDIAKEVTVVAKDFSKAYQVGDREKTLIDNTIKMLEGYAQDTSMFSISAADTAKLDSLLAEKNYLEYFGILNGDGITVAATARSEIGKDFSFRPYYKECIAGRVSVSEPYISTSKNYCINIAVPLEREGKPAGVLMADLLIG